MKTLSALALTSAFALMTATPALAHPGHGTPMPHAHDTLTLWAVAFIFSLFSLVLTGQSVIPKKAGASHEKR